jgi:hypothetical protein
MAVQTATVKTLLKALEAEQGGVDLSSKKKMLKEQMNYFIENLHLRDTLQVLGRWRWRPGRVHGCFHCGLGWLELDPKATQQLERREGFGRRLWRVKLALQC